MASSYVIGMEVLINDGKNKGYVGVIKKINNCKITIKKQGSFVGKQAFFDQCEIINKPIRLPSKVEKVIQREQKLEEEEVLHQSLHEDYNQLEIDEAHREIDVLLNLLVHSMKKLSMIEKQHVIKEFQNRVKASDVVN